MQASKWLLLYYHCQCPASGDHCRSPYHQAEIHIQAVLQQYPHNRVVTSVKYPCKGWCGCFTQLAVSLPHSSALAEQ